MKTTHYVYECGSPRWECGVELLVRDVCGMTLAVAVCSLPRTSQEVELHGLVVLSLATVSIHIYIISIIQGVSKLDRQSL